MYKSTHEQFILEMLLETKASFEEQLKAYTNRIAEIYDERQAKGMCKYIEGRECHAQCGLSCRVKIIQEYRENGWLK